MNHSVRLTRLGGEWNFTMLQASISFKLWYSSFNVVPTSVLLSACAQQQLENTSLGLCQSSGSHPPQNTTRGSSRQVVTVRDRCADVVIYDVVNQVTVAVFEIKEDERAAITAQHNEQMLGLWDGRQQVMLGFEMRGSNVSTPKILLKKEDKMHMYTFEELYISSNKGLHTLASMLLAFLVHVDYVHSM